MNLGAASVLKLLINKVHLTFLTFENIFFFSNEKFEKQCQLRKDHWPSKKLEK